MAPVSAPASSPGAGKERAGACSAAISPASAAEAK